MASSHDGFDANKMRREIFEARSTNIWMVLEFIAELANVLTQKGRQHDFVYVADRLVGLLQGNVKLKNLMLYNIISTCDVECEGMLKYYIEFEKLLNDCVVRIDILIKIGKRYLKTACCGEAIEYMLKADNIADELNDKARKNLCSVYLGHAYLHLADYGKAIQYFNKGLVLSTDIGDRSGIANNSSSLGHVYCILRQFEQAIEYLNKGLAISTELRDQSGIVTCYGNLGIAYFGMGQNEKAVEYLNKGLTIWTELKDQSRIATCYGNLGIAYSSMGQYETAIEHYKKGLKISTEVGDRSGQARMIGRCGMSYYHLRQYEEAIEWSNKGLELSTEIGYQIEIATNNEFLGNAYLCLKQPEKAIVYFEKGLEISTKIGYRSGISCNYANLGEACRWICQYAKSIKYLNQGRAISTEMGDRSRVSIICKNLGHTYHCMGQYSKSVEHYNEALEINTEIGDRLVIASNHDNLGDTYTMLGQYEKAIEYLNTALAINSEIGNCQGRACNYNHLGNAYIKLGQYEKAIEYLYEGLAINSKIGNQSGIANGNESLGNAFWNIEQHEKAIEYYNKCLKIRTEIGDPSGIASCWINLGIVYNSLGKYEKAIEFFNKSLSISSEIESWPPIVSSIINLGVAYHNLGSFEKAITFFQKSYELSVEIGNPCFESLALGNMGESYLVLSSLITCESEAMSKVQHAVSLIQRSVQCSDKMFFDLSVDENKISFTTEYFKLYVNLMYCFILLKRITAALLVIDLGKAKALLAFIEKRKKLDIVDHMACYTHEIWRKIDNNEEEMQIDDFRKAIQLKENNSTILFYSFDLKKCLNIWVLNGDDEVERQILRRSKDLTSPEDYIFCKLEMFLNAHSVDLSRDSAMYKLDSDSSLGAQPKNAEIRWSQMMTSFNDFVCTKEKSNVSDLENSENMHLQKSHSCNSIFLHNVSDNSELKMRTLVEVVQRYDLAIDVAKLRFPVKQSSVNCSNTTEVGALLQALFQALIDPVKKFIKGTKLIIVPDKFLFFAPFCALLDENSCPMSERYSFQITPSLQTLYSRMKESHDASLGFALFVGNPTLGEVSFCGERLYVSQLPNATIEAQLLASRFDAKPLVEGEATKERVLKYLPSASIIHIAAHGDRKRGEIFLAPNPSSPLPKEESYLLKEKDIFDIKINAKLVVLCCCHTGNGHTSSEGVVGIARAFLAAGARSVLATLWRIHDAGTKVFMEKFYDEICNETSVCEALRRTMNMLRRHENHFYRDVQIWAPFTIYGEDVKFSRQDIDEIKRKSREMTM